MPKAVKKSAKKSQKLKKAGARKKAPVLVQPQPKYQRVLVPLLLAIIGINLFVIGATYLVYRKTVLSFRVAPVITADMKLRAPEPTHITIPDVNINLAIEPATIENGIWYTSDKNATHLVTSARPGEGNNIVIYGHNLRKIFGPLHQVKKDDVIEVTNADGKIYQYTVADIQTVTPDQVEKVLPTDYEVLTVYTCTGFLDSKRLVIRAVPSGVRSTQ